MPEGLEVHVIIKQLNAYFAGKTLFKCESKLIEKLPLQLKNINCKRKFIYFKFEHEIYLGNRLGMTGNWRIARDKNKYTVTTLYFENGIAHFDDMRRFENLQLLTTKKLNDKLAQLGPDVLNAKFTLEIFKERLKKFANSKMPIANLLINQEFISGISNYLQADILYSTGIHPLNKISHININSLYNAIIKIMCESYRLGDTTIKTYHVPLANKKMELSLGKYKPIIYGRKFYNNQPVKTMKLNNWTIYFIENL